MVIILKKQFYFMVNFFASFLITLSALSAAEESQDLSHEVRFQQFSSEVSPLKIGVNIYNIVKNATTSIIIASDQCANEDFLDKVLKLRDVTPELRVGIVIGDDQNDASILWNDKYLPFTRKSIPKLDNGGKMHNKFIIVDNKIVITGSPNLSKAAYNLNIESFVCIENPHVAGIYSAYYEYIIDQTDGKKLGVLELMTSWNNIPNIPIQVCLAPIASISDFIIQRLDAARIVKINMYLVGQATIPDNDLVSHLSTLGNIVTLMVDKKNYDSQEYIRTALGVLVDSGAHVVTVSKSKKKKFHDKLMLIEYEDGSKRVIIGSAGFSTSVQDNINFENMVSINNNETYDFLLSHFNSINTHRGFTLEELS